MFEVTQNDTFCTQLQLELHLVGSVTSTQTIKNQNLQKPADKDTPTQNSNAPDLGTLRTQLATDDDLHTLGTVLHDESAGP